MWAIFQFEVKYYFKSKVEAIYLYSFFLSILLLAPFTQNINSIELQSLASLTLWIALASAVALGGASLFQREVAQGRLACIQSLPVSLEGVVFAKWLAFFVFIMLPLLAALPLAGFLFNLSFAVLVHFAVGLVAGSLALTVLTCLAAVATCGMNKAGAMMGLLILPLTIPVMIFGAAYCRDLSAIWQPNLLFLLGFAFFMLPIMCVAGAHSIRSSH